MHSRSNSRSADADPEYQGVCVNPETNQRIDYNQCDDDGNPTSSGFLWYYFLLGRSYPAVGAPLGAARTGTDYVTTAPKNSSYVRGGGAKTGGSVSATSLSKSSTTGGKTTTTKTGGFGSSAKGVSGS